MLKKPSLETDGKPSAGCRCHEKHQTDAQSSADCRCQERRNSESPRKSLLQTLVSRRGILASLLGAAGGVGVLNVPGGKEAAAQSPALDSEWMSMLQVAIANSRNQAVLFKRGKGLIASFGDNLYIFDQPTNSFGLFTGQSQVLKGTVETRVTGALDRIQIGNTLTHVQNIEAANGSALRITNFVQLIDGFFNFQINTEVGIPNQNPTFRTSMIYDARSGFIPEGFETSGLAPTFDLTLLQTAARLISNNFNARVSPNPVPLTIVEKPPTIVEKLTATFVDPVRGSSLTWECKAACVLCGAAGLACILNPLLCPAVGVCAECFSCN